MAVSKVGLGWPAGERNYNTLRAWRDALINSSQFEEAWCKGDLGTSFVTISGTNFPQGALIRGDVEYAGNNRDELAVLFSQMQLLRAAPNVTVRDLYIRHSSASQTALIAGAGNTALRCHIEHTGLPGINNAVALAQTGGSIRNCVVIGVNTANNYTLRVGANGITENCVAINGQYPFYSNFNTSSNAGIFALNSNVSDFLLQNSATTTNSASSDGSGNYTGYTVDEFVDFAAGDYRIKATSDLASLGIGAFFEPPSGGEDQLVTINLSAQLSRATPAQITQNALVSVVAAQEITEAVPAVVAADQVTSVVVSEQDSTAFTASISADQVALPLSSEQDSQAQVVAVSIGQVVSVVAAEQQAQAAPVAVVAQQVATTVAAEQDCDVVPVSVVAQQVAAVSVAEQSCDAPPAEVYTEQVVAGLTAQQNAQAVPAVIVSGGEFVSIPAEQATEAAQIQLTADQCATLRASEVNTESVPVPAVCVQVVSVRTAEQRAQAVPVRIDGEGVLLDVRLMRVRLAPNPLSVILKPQRFSVKNITPDFGIRIKNG